MPSTDVHVCGTKRYHVYPIEERDRHEMRIGQDCWCSPRQVCAHCGKREACIHGASRTIVVIHTKAS